MPPHVQRLEEGSEVRAVRRSPYGANPELGRHGTRARPEILHAARRLFAENGYRNTTVEAIGKASNRSGAAVYQYFAGKSEIFKVFTDELAHDVLVQAGRLGEMDRVQPGPMGLAEIRSRLGELADVIERHRTTFALWPFAERDEPTLRGSAETLLRSFADVARPALAPTGVPAEQEPSLAIAMAMMTRWSHATRIARAPELDAGTLDDVLARVTHFLLFSAFPAEPSERLTGAEPTPLTARPPGARPLSDPGVVPGVRRPVTARSRATLRRITSAATPVFRRNGFQGTTVNEIAVAAGVSPASVYTYWADRSALFTTLAHEAAVALADHIEATPAGFASADEGRAWLRRWIELIAAHGAVLHVWTHEVVHDDQLGPFARKMQRHVAAFLDSLLRAAPAGGLVGGKAARIVAWALLTDVPFIRCEQLGADQHEEFLDALSMLLIRGLFGYR